MNYVCILRVLNDHPPQNLFSILEKNVSDKSYMVWRKTNNDEINFRIKSMFLRSRKSHPFFFK